MNKTDRERMQEAKSKVTYQGVLEINYANGTITFTSGGIRVLRVTHLITPVPKGMSFDMVALENLTSLTPIQIEEHHGI